MTSNDPEAAHIIQKSYQSLLKIKMSTLPYPDFFTFISSPYCGAHTSDLSQKKSLTTFKFCPLLQLVSGFHSAPVLQSIQPDQCKLRSN